MSILSRAIAKYLEPHVQAMITRRIVTFHDGLVRDGVIKWTKPGHSLAADKQQLDPPLQPPQHPHPALPE